METRPYFLFGDCFSNALVGAISGWAGVVWMPHMLGFWLGMLVSMVGAMLITMLLSFTLLLRWFGAHEVMVPTMIGGMTANMSVCLLHHLYGLSAMQGLWIGAMIGLGVLGFTYLMNARLSGEVINHG
jgi:hypothetical protein